MITVLHSAFRLILILVLELFLLRNIHYGPWFAPVLFPYLIYRMPVKTGSAAVMVYGFLLGLGIDFFLHSGGVNAFALTLAASLRIPLLRFFLSPEEWDTNLSPGIYKPDFRRFFMSALVFMFIFHLGYHFIAGSFFNSPFKSIGYILAGTFLSLLLFISIEAATKKPKKR
jgi:hypothetical protein